MYAYPPPLLSNSLPKVLKASFAIGSSVTISVIKMSVQLDLHLQNLKDDFRISFRTQCLNADHIHVHFIKYATQKASAIGNMENILFGSMIISAQIITMNLGLHVFCTSFSTVSCQMAFFVNI